MRFLRVRGSLAPRGHFPTIVSISLVLKARVAFAWHFVACHIVPTALSDASSGAVGASSRGTLAAWRGLFSLVFDSKYCCCCCKPPAVMWKAPLCLELTVHEKSARLLSCLTFISSSTAVELPVLSITSLQVYYIQNSLWFKTTTKKFSVHSRVNLGLVLVTMP